MMRKESGFSLIELMVAMTVTLIVSAAIYGLLASGSNAFRREPEVADRQQNIRVAMDMISRDVYTAGAALPTFAQTFSRVDPAGGDCTGAQGLNGCGPLGTLGPDAAANRGSSGDTLEESDVLQLVTVDERCPLQTVCSDGVVAGDAGAFITREGTPDCLPLPGLVLLTDNRAFTIQPATAGAAAACVDGGDATRNGSYTLLDFLSPWNDSPAILAANTAAPHGPGWVAGREVFLYPARIVRYMIAQNPDPLDPVPSLWRSDTGLYLRDGNNATAPGTADSPWELVARGIEDLQLEYLAGVPGPGVWENQPPLATDGDWSSLVRQVRITLSARVTAANLQGETRSLGGGGTNAIRGQLSSVVTPRAAFGELQMGSQIQ